EAVAQQRIQSSPPSDARMLELAHFKLSNATYGKPEQDMIAKRLRRVDFSDVQIRKHAESILICDGYDECQQSRN
ncbi:hypothetical protein BGX34_006320, partial [Mortierella sp. NVP85]